MRLDGVQYADSNGILIVRQMPGRYRVRPMAGRRGPLASGERSSVGIPAEADEDTPGHVDGLSSV